MTNNLDLTPEQRKLVRSYTSRMRQAVRQLPSDINYAQTYRGRPALIKDDLQEIIGAANEIATILGLEI